jgi:predicted MPP superfamily phosphohydrolase
MDADRLDKIVDSINKLEPDIVIYLGDLFDKPLTNSPTATTQAELAELLQKIEAPLGKFAIYGDQDLQSVITKQVFDTIMKDADFEVLSDQNIKLTRQTQASVSLIALNNIINGDVDYEQAFHEISSDNYNLVISHTPDIIDEIVSYKADLLLSGHSLGQQFNLPLLNTITKMEGATNYYHGKTKVAQTLLDITNGLGTTGYDARLFSDPEIVIYLFKQQ